MSEGVPLPGTILAGKYVVARVLGQGGMGIVLEARKGKLSNSKNCVEWTMV